MSYAVILALVTSLSREHGLDPREVSAIIHVESSWNPAARGSLGEIGLLQLRPEFFDVRSGGSPLDVEHNLRIGIAHLASIKRRCPHKEQLSWAICHNVGVRGAFRIKNPTEFVYVRKVQEAYDRQTRIETASR